MPLYQITGPDGTLYEIEGPEGASREDVITAIQRRTQPSAMDRLRELQRRQREAREAPAPAAEPETTIGGNVKEFFKGLVPGAIGLAETAGTGIAAMLPEDTEKAAREKIKEIAGIAKKPFEAGAGYEEAVTRRLGEGLGSTLPFFLLGPAGVAGRLGAAGLGVAAGAGEAREAAEAKGATGEERRTATLLGAPTGLLDLLAPNIAPFRGLITTALARGGVEGATEAAQRVAQNLIAKGVYDPEQPIFAGAGEEGAYGAGVGALASLILDMTVGRKARTAKFGEKPAPPAATPEAPKTPLQLGYEQEPFTPVAMPDGSVITSKSEYDEYVRRQEADKRQREEDLRTSDRLAGLPPDQRELARRGKTAALAETFAQEPEPGQLGLPGIERADGTVEIPGRGRVTPQFEAEPTVEPAVERDTRTRDMIDELETTQLRELEEADKSAELRKLLEVDRAKAERQRLKFESDLAELDGRLKAKQEKTTQDKRLELLLPIVESDVKNIPKAFVQTLKREGFTNPNLTERERNLINRVYDIRLLEEPAPAAPEVEPSAPSELAELEAAVPEKKTTREPEQLAFPGMGKPKGAKPEAFSEAELAQQEEKPFATKLTPEVLEATGLPKQSGFYKQLVGMDMADVNQQPVVANIFAKVRANPNLSQSTKDAIERIAMQAFGGLAKQRELFGGRKGAPTPPPQGKPAEKKTEAPAKEAPSGRGRAKDEGDVGRAARTRPEGGKAGAVAAEPSGAPSTTRAKESKPAGVGDRRVAPSDAGARKEDEQPALRQTSAFGALTPEQEAKLAKAAPGRVVKPGEVKAAPAVDQRKFGAYSYVDTASFNYSLRNLANDLFVAMYPQKDVAKNLTEIRNKLASKEWPEINFGQMTDRAGHRNFQPGMGGKYAKAFYESLTPDQKELLRKQVEYNFNVVEDQIQNGLSWYNGLQAAKHAQIDFKKEFDENLELAGDMVRTYAPLYPQVIDNLKAGKLTDALTAFAGNLTNRPAKIARALAKALGNVKVEVVKDLRSPSGRQLAGDYDAATNTIRLDAATGMNAHALLHEVTHAAVHKILSNKNHPLTKQLTELFNNVKGSLDSAYGAKSLDEFVSEVFSNPEFQQKLATINPKGEPISALRRFLHAVSNYVRSALGMNTRGLGTALDTADMTIMQILSPTSTQVGGLYEASLLGESKAVFSALDNRIMSMSGMSNPVVQRIYEVLRQSIPTVAKTSILRSLPLNALTEVAAKDIPMAPQLDVLEKQWNGAIDERRRAVDATMQRISKWIKGNPEKEAKLNDVIAESTLNEVDPSKPRSEYKGQQTKGNEDKQAVWDKLQTDWTALGPEGQSIYKQMRDAYTESHERLINLLFNRIDASVKDPAEAKQLRTEIYKRLAVKGKIEPYFPLMRQGDYWVTFNAKGPDGNLEYYKMAFKTSVERDRAIRELKADANVDAKSVQKSSPTGKRDYKSAPPTSFVNNILKVLEANKVDSTVTDEIMRVFIDTLPESSFAQSFRKRLGTLGFMRNASEVFYTKSLSMAHQLANLEYGAKMYKLRDEMEEHINTKNKTEEARLVFDTLDRQIKSMVSPDIAPWAKAATSTAFGFTLGFNVSSALVNLTQLPMVVMPYLGGKYGFTDANKALGSATRMFFGSGLKRRAKTVGGGDPIELKAGYSLDNYDFVGFDDAVAAYTKKTGRVPTAAERKQIAEKVGLTEEQLELRELSDLASQYGLLSRSMISDVLETGTQDSPLSKVNAWSGFIFHHGERMNRQISMIAAYKLELDRMKAGGKELTTEDRQAAAQEAIRLTELLNGGASANSAPVFAKNSLGKLLFMYKRYGISMYYMLFKTTKEAMSSENPEVRAAAKRQIAGVYAASAILAGAQGMPMFGVMAAMYNLFLKDDDEDDAETAARKYLGEGMFNGALNYYTGTAIANRIGLTDLLFHSTGYREQDSAVLSFLQLVGGPVYGVADRFSRGAKLIMDGETQRGLEQVMPAAFGNILKGYRFGTEGATTLRGDPIIGEIGTGHALSQAFGFAPAEYTRQLEENAALKNIERRTLEKRTELLRKFYIATRSGDGDAASDYMSELLEMNKKHPGLVTPDTIRRSMKQHMRTSATMYHGITLNKLMRAELLRNASEYDDDITMFRDEGED